jgi:hypothetical protein
MLDVTGMQGPVSNATQQQCLSYIRRAITILLQDVFLIRSELVLVINLHMAPLSLSYKLHGR